LLGINFVAAAGENSTANAPVRPERLIVYTNDVIPDVPWSIHILKIERGHSEVEFYTTLGKTDTFGMSTVSEQIKSMPATAGKPLAAINGDFYETSKDYQGRPRDLQIRDGEVVSTPAGHTSFWIDRDGNPQMTNVHSLFKVTWPNRKSTPLGLNQERAEDAAVLFTSVVGATTRTSGGVEIILESATNDCWLPLRIGQTYPARVRAVRQEGDTPVGRDTMVLSLGPKLADCSEGLKPGAILQISTATVPDLMGVTVAIGGGPALVRDGKVMHWNGMVHVRHPRSALGWNKDHLFLVEVDGRQNDISLGMTFPEFAGYLVKLGCEQAMNLDGGGSATLWLLGDVRNSPSEGRERPAANSLVLVKKKSSKN
jgi:hypothetical protein